VSCCEAGRDAFWVHRFLERLRIENIVVDAASMKVSRHGRRAKNDRIDAAQLLNDLVRYHRGETDVWRVVRIPSEQDEDDRRPHREMERLKKERTQHRSRIQALLATQGVQVKGSLMRFLECVGLQPTWNGQRLAENLLAEIERERSRLELVESQIASIKEHQRKAVKTATTAKLQKVAKLTTLRGIGLDSAWLLEMELLGWREFSNRREVGGSVGLGGTPYDSGQMTREQGISKVGNSRVRARLIELAWLWLRYQPRSSVTQWFEKRFGAGGKRAKRVGIVAVARKLLIQLWHFVEHDVVPTGAIIVAS
jgi:transposase